MSTINIDGIVLYQREDGTYHTQLLGSLLRLRTVSATLGDVWVAELRTQTVRLPPTVHRVSACGSTQRRALHALRRTLEDASAEAWRDAGAAEGQDRFAWLLLHCTYRGCASALQVIKHELEVPHA